MNKLLGKFSSMISFSKLVLKEFKHLKIPTRAETISYLIIVLVMALISALMFFVIDHYAYKFVTAITTWFA